MINNPVRSDYRITISRSITKQRKKRGEQEEEIKKEIQQKGYPIFDRTDIKLVANERSLFLTGQMRFSLLFYCPLTLPPVIEKALSISLKI